MKSTDGAGQTETTSSSDGTNANESPQANAGEGGRKRKRKGPPPASVPPPVPRAQQAVTEKNNGARQRKETNPAQDTPTQQHGDNTGKVPIGSLCDNSSNDNTLERDNAMKSTEASTQTEATVATMMSTRRHAPLVRDENVVLNLVERTVHLMKLVDTLEQSTLPVENRYHHDVSMITMTKCFHNPLTSNCDKGQTHLLGLNTFTQWKKTIAMSVYPKMRRII